jgi:hypothetical protein
MEDAMSSRFAWFRWRPSLATLIGGAVVILGFALAQWYRWDFLALVGLGAFGPGILRELGWLNDQDEFQRRAAHRAGYHAFVVTGVVAFIIYAYTRAGGTLKQAEELSMVYLALLWFTWLFSSLFSYWGPRRTAFRILFGFGCVWGVFNVLGNLRDPLGMLMQLLVTTAPFFVLAYVSRRWPRVAGAFLVALSLFFLGYYFYPGHFANLLFLVKIGTAVLFVGPLLASGVALLGGREGPVAAGLADAPGVGGRQVTAEAG